MEKIYKFKTDSKDVNFPTQFFLRTISNGFGAAESREGNVYVFSVDYNIIDKSDILNIYKYLMINNNLKWCWSLFNKCLLDY